MYMTPIMALGQSKQEPKLSEDGHLGQWLTILKNTGKLLEELAKHPTSRGHQVSIFIVRWRVN